MIKLCYDERYPPSYMTHHSSGADLCANEDVLLPPGASRAVGTGVYITEIDWDIVPPGCVPEILLKARSGLARRHSITLLNGVGTVDADYRDEIKVLLWNVGEREFKIKAGDRIAQMVLSLSYRLPILPQEKSTRQGGFGFYRFHRF